DGRAGPAVQVTAFGLTSLSQTVGAWTVTLDASGNSGSLIIDADGPRAVGGGEARITLRFGSAFPLPPVGAAEGPRLELGFIGLRGEIVAGAQADYGVAFEAPDIRLVVQAPSGDGFLGRFLPEEGLQIPAGFTLGWSKAGGLRFAGGTALAIRRSPEVSARRGRARDEAP